MRVNESSLLSGSLSSPSLAYSQETITLSVDNSLGVIVYALIVRDDAGNPSKISNIVSARMEYVDLQSPAKVSDLKWTKASFSENTVNTVTLEWTAVGDDQYSGTGKFTIILSLDDYTKHYDTVYYLLSLVIFRWVLYIF